MKIARLFAIVVTLVSVLVASHLQLSRDLTSLFPRTPEADALARVTRAFGGGDVALVLVRAADSASAEHAVELVATELRRSASIASVLTSAPAAPTLDPTEAWRFAGPVARERLAKAVTEEGMRERLRETRLLLLSPGASDAVEFIARDPLRLAMIPWQDRIEIAAGARGMAGGAFVTDEGRTRLVVIEPRGHAFDSREAARFTMEAEASLERVRAREPLASLDLTGGHVVATQTESLMRTDLEKSSVLALVLASLVFVVTFRRVRALVAVLPPLVIGTLWTTALAALVYPHLSAVATAFSAVVIGVGVDTGVHVYGRLLRARREGLSSRAAADSALRETWRPTLGAALAAGGAFGCLALSDIEGMRQLGVLCAAGEVLTALAILAVVPEVGALLERGPRPPLPRASWVASLTKTRGRALIAIALVAVAIALSLSMGPPRIDHAVVRFDARALPALKTYAEIDAAFGGDREQWIVVSADRDLSHARSRAEAVAEAADRLVAGGSIAGFDALARLAPSSALQQRRLVERDRLDLPSRKALLARILAEEGFAVDAFDRALESFANPSNDTSDVLADDRPGIAWLRRRYLATDDRGALAVTYVRTSMATDGDDSRVILRAADPEAVVTGFADLERNLTRTLGRDLRRVLAGAACVVFLVLGVTLRRPSRVALALLVLFVEIVVVVALSGPLGIRWHVYDALVLPVLLGITLDEVLFLLDAAERTSIDEAIAEQAPLGTATALTTAFGFGALLVCRFDGLVDVGKVGALGSVIGLVLALVVVPATYRLFVWKK